MLRSIAVAFLLAGPAIAQTTIQQDFDAGQAALDAKDIAGARQKFEALLKRMPEGSRSRSMGVVKSRLGVALVRDGEQEAAIPLLTDAIAIFDKGTPEDLSERADALYARAQAHEELGQFVEAADDFRAVRALWKPEAGSASDIALKSALARVSIWTDPAESRRLLDELIAMPPETWGKNKITLALLHDLRGRVELNDGKPEEALEHFRKAMRLAGGGQTTRIDLNDVRVRADAAIAAYVLGNSVAHQQYVAYSGGGSLVTVGLASARSLDLPRCGAETGLAPDDVAVVEFGIHPDGRVRSAQPIYVKRADGRRPDGRGGPETLFVQAARNWFWNPKDLEKVDSFWRQALRVEVRCSNARPENDLVWDSIMEGFHTGIAGLGLPPLPPPPDDQDAAVAVHKAELERRIAQNGATSLETLPPLTALATNGKASVEDRAKWFEQAAEVLEASGRDPQLAAISRFRAISLGEYGSKSSRAALGRLVAAEEAARPNARTTQFLRLEQAGLLHEARQPQAAETLLRAIVATPQEALGRVDPIRTTALLRLSNIAAARKDLETAAAALAATGLSPEQCALVDVRPRRENSQVSSGIFPPEAHRWGSGGMTRVEYDIGTDGKPRNARTVMAAPPFVFGKATEKGAMQLRYEPVFRPGNTQGCVGESQNFRFSAR
ncbi:hypothetical protein L6Q21_04280 [Sandaracinobacter sp. RS1-74]|uniref:hypothetical protein n=1 Tax=Sandaracinobacteroides sayramensis TaxID=2913411 RepID=UPI001EDA2625|nr:hypothetical protein [Sandaracinobacteroides sayramensis]MCG2840198.1 hypothetical protein [Sandaracinobacteroides sayramensis]